MNKEQATNTFFFSSDGSPRLPMILLLSTLALLWMGRWYYALTTLTACLVAALCNAMDEIKEEDKQEIRYNIMEAEDVLEEMKQNVKEDSTHGRMILVTALGTLAKKYGRQTSLAKTTKPDDGDSSPPPLPPHALEKHTRRLQELSLLCQEAAYFGFSISPRNDDVVAAAMSLLALVAKQDVVRQRHIEKADVYGLNVPIGCMRDALERAKDVADDDNTTTTTTKMPQASSSSSTKALLLSAEQRSAELQRKGCLLLGALADGDDDSSMARLVAQEGGIEAVLEAADWFRYHADVANWALWAIFILTYEDLPNKTIVVQNDGVPVVIRALKSVPESVEVARHGIAILFDLMREQDETAEGPRLDIWRIRNAALNEGIHDVIVAAMREYSTAMDIIMMGQAILVGTDYQGEIPQFQPVK